LGTVAWGINASSQIVGSYVDASSLTHGYLFSAGGYTTLDVPGSTATEALGINDAGQIVGDYLAGGGQHGFLLSGGSYTMLDVPGSTLTVADGINAAGQIVGSYNDSDGTRHGFLATPVPEPATLLLGIGTLGMIGWAWRRHLRTA
jgi:probable HAF family extracellular repeat protein